MCCWRRLFPKYIITQKVCCLRSARASMNKKATLHFKKQSLVLQLRQPLTDCDDPGFHSPVISAYSGLPATHDPTPSCEDDGVLSIESGDCNKSHPDPWSVWIIQKRRPPLGLFWAPDSARGSSAIPHHLSSHTLAKIRLIDICREPVALQSRFRHGRGSSLLDHDHRTNSAASLRGSRWSWP